MLPLAWILGAVYSFLITRALGWVTKKKQMTIKKTLWIGYGLVAVLFILQQTIGHTNGIAWKDTDNVLMALPAGVIFFLFYYGIGFFGLMIWDIVSLKKKGRVYGIA